MPAEWGPTPFVILSTARSGTNLLRGMLDQHPGVRCLDEILLHEVPLAGDLDPDLVDDSAAQEALSREFTAEPERFLLERVFRDPTTPRDACGFRLFYEHPPGPMAERVWTFLAGLSGLKVVHLRRKGELRRYVSLLQALETDVWLQPAPSELPPPPVYVDAGRFLEAAAAVERDRERALARLSRQPRLDLVYETLAREPEREARRVLEFLGVAPIALRPLHARQGSEALRASVVNHRSLRARLTGTPWAAELDDERGAAHPLPPPGAWTRRSDDTLRLFGQIGEADLDILPAFLDHYAALGVRRFHLVLHGTEEGRRALREAVGRRRVEVEEEDGGPFDDRVAYARLTRLARRHPGEWAIVADADELLELPYGDFPRTIRALSLAGATSLPALLVQRLAPGGVLAALEPGADPQLTYPLASVSLAARLAPALPPWLEKASLFLVHDGTELALGHHLPPDGLARSPLPLRAVVHHFKWRAGLVGSQRRRCGEPLTNAHEVVALDHALEERGGILPAEGAFVCSREALFERGLLRRPDRAQRRHGARLTRLRRSTEPGVEASPTAAPEDGAGAGRRRRAGGPPCPRALPGRIAFVTHELCPPTRTGGIGSYVAAAAQSLAAAGHVVTVALLSPMSEAEALSWKDVWWRRGIELQCLAGEGGRPFGDPNVGGRVAAWLHGRAFDLVHFADCGGLGAEATAARRQGLLLASTTTAVTLHGGVSWHTRANGSPRTAEELRLGHAESVQLAAADWMLSPSRFMLEELERSGASLPDRRAVLPSVIGADVRAGGVPASAARREGPGLGEIVFFGRLEPRKGVDLFCDALDHLAGWRPDVSTAFFGAAATPEWRSFVEARGQRWGRPSLVHENLSPGDAVLLLCEGGRLAVMPSRADNHPYTVLECLTAGVPFLASAVGGIPEMVHADDHARVLVAPDAAALADAIRRAVDEGHAPARPALGPEEVEQAFLAWHAARLTECRRDKPPAAPARHPPQPSLDLVLLSDPDGGYAVPTAEALARQRGVEFELRVGDDSLSDAEAARVWRRGPRVGKGCRGVRSVTAGERGAGPERANALVAASEADYLLFCRAGVVPDVRLAALLLRACRAESAEAAVSDYFALPPLSSGGPAAACASTAGPVALAAHENLFGGCCFLIRRTSLEALGGFRDDPALEGVEHWDLLNRLLLDGGRVARVPLPLYRLAAAEDAVPDLRPPRRAIRAGWAPFLERVPRDLRETFSLLVDVEWSPEHPQLARLRVPPEAPAENPGLSLLSIAGSGVEGALEAVQQVRVEASSAAVEVVSSGPDPILRLPPLQFPPGRQAIRVLVEMDCERSSLAQLFWLSEGRADYTEEDSVRSVTLRGPNVVQLQTPEIVPAGRLRFDPAVHPGRIAIRSLRVETHPAVAPDPVAEAPPPESAVGETTPALSSDPCLAVPSDRRAQDTTPSVIEASPASGPGFEPLHVWHRARRWLRGARDSG